MNPFVLSHISWQISAFFPWPAIAVVNGLFCVVWAHSSGSGSNCTYHETLWCWRLLATFNYQAASYTHLHFQLLVAIYIHVHIRMCISFLFSPFLKFSVPSIFSRIGWAMSTSLLHCCILSLGYAALAAFIRFSANVNSSKAPPLFLSTAQIVQWAHTAHCQLCGCPHTLRRFNLVLFFFFL